MKSHGVRRWIRGDGRIVVRWAGAPCSVCIEWSGAQSHRYGLAMLHGMRRHSVGLKLWFKTRVRGLAGAVFRGPIGSLFAGVILLGMAGCAGRSAGGLDDHPPVVRSVRGAGLMPGVDAEQRIRTFASEWYPRVCRVLGDAAARGIESFDVVLVPQLPEDARGATRGNRIRLNAGYLVQNPGELEYVLLHEMVHVAQGYRGLGVPVHWAEGIADAVPAMLGYTNVSWCPVCPLEFPHYTSGYRCAAAFLLHIETVHGPGVLRRLNADLRSGNYSDRFFVEATGRDLPTLWAGFCRTDAYSPLAEEANALREQLGYLDGKRPRRFEKRVDRWLGRQPDADALRRALGYGRNGPPRDVDLRFVAHRHFQRTRGRWTQEAADHLLAKIRSGRLPEVAPGLWLDLLSTPVADAETWPLTRVLRGRRPADPDVYEFRLEKVSGERAWELREARRIHPGGIRSDVVQVLEP